MACPSRSCANWVGLAHYSSQVEWKLGQLGGYRPVRSHNRSWSDTTISESSGGAFVCGKEAEDGTHPRPRRRIRVHTCRCWTHYRSVSQLRRNHARTTRRRGNADERAIIGIERESDRPTGFPLRRFRRFHTLRAENNQSSSFHRLPPSAGRLLVGERNPWSNQLIIKLGFTVGEFSVWRPL